MNDYIYDGSIYKEGSRPKHRLKNEALQNSDELTEKKNKGFEEAIKIFVSDEDGLNPGPKGKSDFEPTLRPERRTQVTDI